MGGLESEINSRKYQNLVIKYLNQELNINKSEIIDLTKTLDYKNHDYDIDLPKYDLKIEVKGCKHKWRNKKRGTIGVDRTRINGVANYYFLLIYKYSTKFDLYIFNSKQFYKLIDHYSKNSIHLRITQFYLKKFIAANGENSNDFIQIINHNSL
jgi:hypothetical protein